MVTSVEKRWEAVFAWKATKSIKNAARRAELSPKAKRLWVKRYMETGGVGQLPKSGRPSLMSAKAKVAAYEMLVGGELQGAAGVAVELQRKGITPKKVSKTTMLRSVKAEGATRGQPLVALRGRPAKRLSNDTKAKRLVYDPSHRVAAGTIRSWNANEGSSITLLPNWPPNSPDLHPY